MTMVIVHLKYIKIIIIINRTMIVMIVGGFVVYKTNTTQKKNVNKR